MIKIRKELSDSNTGWDFRQVMDLIHKRSAVKYHEVHIYRLLHKWGLYIKGSAEEIRKNIYHGREKEI